MKTYQQSECIDSLNEAILREPERTGMAHGELTYDLNTQQIEGLYQTITALQREVLHEIQLKEQYGRFGVYVSLALLASVVLHIIRSLV